MPIGRIIRYGDVEQERLLKSFLGQNLRTVLYIDRLIGEGKVKLFQHEVFFESFSFQELKPFTFILFPQNFEGDIVICWQS